MSGWKKCLSCGKNLNGYHAYSDHNRKNHADAFALRQAQGIVEMHEMYLSRLLSKQREWREINSFLERCRVLQVEVPEGILQVLLSVRDSKVPWLYPSAPSAEVQFQTEIASSTSYLDKARATLAELESVAPQ